MNEQRRLVHAVIAEVQRLRELDFRGPDDCVQQLLNTYSSDSLLADLLWQDLPEETSVQVIADILSLWSWRTDDNGSSIMRAVESWMDRAEDEKKVAVALELDAYPFVDHYHRITKLKAIATRFPKLAQRCEEMITYSKSLLAK